MSHKEIFLRLNKYIAFYRRLRLKHDALGVYKQEEFVKVHPDDENYGVIHKNKICSTSLLSRLEQCKTIAKMHVYDMLLAKLDAQFVFRESNLKTQDYLCQRVINLFFDSNKDISTLRFEIDQYSELFNRNCLWTIDLEAIESILDWFETDLVLSRSKFEKLYAKFDVYHAKLKHILLYYFAFSSYFNPTLWSSIKNVKTLIVNSTYEDEILLAFQSFNHRQQFKLIDIYYRNVNQVKPCSYLYQVLIKFKKVFVHDSLHGFLTDDDFLEILLNEYTTNNNQFKKLVHRAYTTKKYNRYETRYLLQNFLIYEPFPFSFSKILLNHLFSKITRENYKKEFLGWKKAN